MNIGLPTTVVKRHVDMYGPIRGVGKWARKAYLRKRTSADGLHVFDAEWDALVVLDACRPDLWDEVSDEYGFADGTRTVSSVGSATAEWMPKTFDTVDKETLARTAYVCANPFSEQFLDPADFLDLDEVWRYAWDDDVGTVRPRPVTDRAVEAGRRLDYDRLIVHYLQPHVPFLSSSESPALATENFSPTADGRLPDDWELVEQGERDLSTVWAEYRDNLRIVLDDVELLLSNLDAETVVLTSDHGNAVGEHGLYGHPGAIAVPALREVPWCETTAIDEGTHEPEQYDTTEVSESVSDRLEKLGYY
jgi:hypothetical protein